MMMLFLRLSLLSWFWRSQTVLCWQFSPSGGVLVAAAPFYTKKSLVVVDLLLKLVPTRRRTTTLKSSSVWVVCVLVAPLIVVGERHFAQ